MNSIGFTNFRKFIDFSEKDLGDITIMVGGNNAGKSTLVKAMLLMRDFLKSRIESASTKPTSKPFNPQFSFDAEHVNVGDFYRAFCRQSPSKEDTISFAMKIDNFHFTVNIRGERKPGIIPEVSRLIVSYESGNKDVTFTFDFSINQMTAHFEYDKKALNDDLNLEKILGRQDQIKQLKKRLSKSQDLGEISDLNLQIEHLEKEIESQKKFLDFNISEYDEVTIDIPRFKRDVVGRLVIPELVNNFVQYSQTGTLGDKRSLKYKEQEANKSFLQGKEEIINTIVNELDSVLNNQVVEYIYSHSVTQTPCYSNATSSNDYATRTIHDFYRSRVSHGDEEFRIIEDGLKLFEIGKSLKVMPFLGDSYRVVIFDEENPEIEDAKEEGYPGGMDLADKGMGSIQIILLLLRLATLARKYKGLNLTVLLEEPEQNLHPALQSKLADLLYILNKDFNVRFVIETHSEYLVRHVQVLAAKQLYEDGVLLADINNKSKVYYLSQERGVVDMLFEDNAKFKDSFDEGFFDQAARESLTISRLERLNKNR